MSTNKQKTIPRFYTRALGRSARCEYETGRTDDAAGHGRRHAPGRTGSPRKGPPGRRDPRRPGTGPRRARPEESALRAAARRDREHQPHQWFAQQLQLVLSGRRPVHSLLGHVRGEAFDQLTRLAAHTPLRPRGTNRSAQAVLAVGGQQPVSGVVEAFARITTGSRTRAMAFRLELCADLRWRCSAVELDGVRTAGRG
ncbi:Rv3235 family protein [Streptomyces armeniacus]|uniref:Rv3235 family protein n=1 Tax=Streptomyces armeniacus TaxID=83291 RepID=UPI001FE260D8|nr:Rv3235 family protein [Streptomyces armeniacus]